ncbi:MAG: 2-oxoacid:ferredoxin oxidoreductase subunit beta [Phycisphaeraceae bacterium]|nr:2-oxoacid:ferredoxin oxidoreductase subunit beta [Phycisphaeraceae bacterium]
MSNSTTIELPTYKASDFASDQDVRWCPGCGDYAVLTGIRKALAKLRHKKEDYVFVSGIGCAARFPYYMETYGLHSIHGRACAVATGVKMANPGLQVCIVSGDGDLLSIGGNHTLHALRRNIDLTIVLLNNRIYGLTKGQASPTSEVGKVTKSTPLGSVDQPVNPLSFALAAGATFVARAIDVDLKAFDDVYQRAMEHHGASMVEVYQDCNIFNHAAWFYASQKDTKADNTIVLEHGKPLVFGAERNKGIRFNGSNLEVVELGGAFSEADLLVHDETNRRIAYLLTQMEHPEFPEPLGVFYVDPETTSHGDRIQAQLRKELNRPDAGDLQKMITGNSTWTVRG